MNRPTPDEYFMTIAQAVRARANCLGRRVGAVLVRDRRILSTGYNGAPSKMVNCDEGGCRRCARPDQYASGEGYDVCICVHAEQNTLLGAARFGVSVEGCTIYTTLQPCFGCLKELIQAKVIEVCYLHPWPSKFEDQDRALVAQFEPGRFRQVAIPDPDEEWARGRGAPLERALGHESQG